MESCSLVLGPLKLLCAAAPEASSAPPAGASAATLGLLALLLLSPLLYLTLNTVLPTILGTQDLKKKYCATWALVTGSSSGIGKELARRLLAQGLSVVLVARKESVFDETVAELQSSFPAATVLKVEADLSDGEGKWMAAVEKAVGDKDVQVCFLNAGYMITGMFEQNSSAAHLANLHCNLTANVHLAHYLYGRLLSRQTPGCLVFTSSSAGFIPTPFAAMYATSKAAISAFAASLACEGRARGVHVHAVHPSPVNSRFSKGGGNDITLRKVSAMDFFYKFATGPEALPDLFFRAVGRSAVVADLGGVSLGLRLLVQLLGYNFIAFASALTAHLSADYQNNIAKAEAKAKAS